MVAPNQPNTTRYVAALLEAASRDIFNMHSLCCVKLLHFTKLSRCLLRNDAGWNACLSHYGVPVVPNASVYFTRTITQPVLGISLSTLISTLALCKTVVLGVQKVA